MRLYDLIQDPDKRRAVVDDSQRILESEVRKKGFVIKGAFKVVKSIKPGFIPMAIDNLLNDFSQQLDPHFETWDQGGRTGTLKTHFDRNGNAIANDLLSVTDKRALTAHSNTVKKTYNKLRPAASKHITAAMPALADMVMRHIG
jgi:hypothetical protein